MALEDIIEKIRTDATISARSILDEADIHADEIISRAQAQANEESRAKLDAANKRALSEAETVRVNGRLEANKVVLAARREIIDEAYEALIESIASLPREKYAPLLAREIVRTAHEGETWTLGTVDSADHELVEAVTRGIDAAQSEVSRGYVPAFDSSLTAPFEHGAYIQGDRTGVELSPAAIVEANKRALEPLLARRLFDETKV